MRRTDSKSGHPQEEGHGNLPADIEEEGFLHNHSMIHEMVGEVKSGGSRDPVPMPIRRQTSP